MSKRFPSPRRPGKKVFRPQFEALEQRWAPATFSWIPNASGDFGVASNWRNGTTGDPGVPGPGDDASVSQNVEVFSAVSRSVNSLRITNGRLRLDGGVFAVTNDFVVTEINQLTVNAGATLRTAGGVTNLNGASIIRGTLDVSAGGQLQYPSGVHSVNAATALTGAGQHLISGGTLSLTVNQNAPPDLELRLGSLAGTANLTIATGITVRWTGGQMTGSGTTVVATNGTLALSGSDIKQLNGRVLTNNGTITWTDGGDFGLNNASRVNNNGTLNVETDADFANGGNFSTFVNTGTLRKQNSTGATSFQSFFNNTGGLIDVQSGTLNLRGGNLTGGTFNAAAGAILDLSGTQNISGTFTGSGAGTVRISSGTLHLLADATFNFPGTLLQWAGGQMTNAAAPLTLTNAGTLTLAGANFKQLNRARLANTGTVVWTGDGDFRLDNASVATNTGTWDIQTDADVRNGGNFSDFTNAAGGTLRKTAGAADTWFEARLNNNGTLTAASGTLDIGVGTSAGTFNATTGRLRFFGNPQTLAPGANFTGTGNVEVIGGFLEVNTNVTIANLIQSTGTLAGSGTVTVSGTLSWTGGTMAGPGRTVIEGTASLSGANVKVLSGRTLDNPGTITWTGNGDFRLDNASRVNNSGTLNIETDADFRNGGNFSTFVNTGTLRKRNSIVETFFESLVNNEGGTIDVQSGTLFLNQGTSTGATITVAADAVLDLIGSGTHNISGGYTGTGEGIVRLARGVLNVLPAEAAFNFEGPLFQWIGGTITGDNLTNDGTLTIAGAATKSLNAGRLTNNGFIAHNDLGDLRLDNGSVVLNNNTWEVQSDAPIRSGGTVSTFQNNSSFYKINGIKESNIESRFNSIAFVGVFSGQVQLSGGGSLAGEVLIAEELELTLGNGTYFLEDGLIVGGDGRFVTEGTAVVNGVVSAVNFGLQSGALVLRPTGILTLSGNYSQEFAAFRVEINGRDLGAGYGQINAAGSATLAGNLQVAFVDGFEPVAGDSFDVISAGIVAGTFANVSVSGLDGRLRLVTDYSETALTLRIEAVGAPGSPGPGGSRGQTVERQTESQARSNPVDSYFTRLADDRDLPLHGLVARVGDALGLLQARTRIGAFAVMNLPDLP